MKRLLASLLVLMLLLCGCEAAPKSDPAKLEYPGLSWGMGVEEAKNVMGIRETDVLREEETINEKLDYDSYGMSVTGLEMFGFETVSVVFQFQDYTKSGNYGLAEIVIYYPDGYHADAVDRDAVQAALEETYGPCLESYDTYLWTGKEVQRTGVWPVTPTWHSEVTVYDLMTEAEQERYYQARCQILTNRGEEVLPDREQLRLTEDEPAAWIRFADRTDRTVELTDEERAEYGWTDNELTLSGRIFVMWDYYFEMLMEFVDG